MLTIPSLLISPGVELTVGEGSTEPVLVIFTAVSSAKELIAKVNFP
jgi:hypothetical protein